MVGLTSIRYSTTSWVSSAGRQLVLLALLLLFLVVASAVPACAAAPGVAWNHTYRLENDSQGYSVVAINDGYVIAGWLATNTGSQALLLKTDQAGRIVWQQTFRGKGAADGTAVKQTRDGGFILAGETSSSSTPESWDVYLVKTDSGGVEQWNHTCGGDKTDLSAAVLQAGDGGYLVAGRTYLPGHSDTDAYILKVDEMGNEQWRQTYGGAGNEWAEAVEQTGDGGYIFAGVTQSSDRYGAFYLVKTDSRGAEQWNKTYGKGSAKAVRQTADRGFILAGSSSDERGNNDLCVIKTDADGNEQWRRTYGGELNDWGRDVRQTPDGGYLVGGSAYSFGSGKGSIYLVKTDETGDLQWDAAYGDNVWIGEGSALELTPDGGCLVTGHAILYEPVYGRLLTRDNSYYQDVYLLKLNDVTSVTAPGSAGIVGGSVAVAESRPVVATGDGYVMCGSLCFDVGQDANSEYLNVFEVYPYLQKTDLQGNVLWTRVYDKLDTLGSASNINAVAATEDGFLLAGSSGRAFNSQKIVLLKADRNGSPLWTKTYSEPNGSYDATFVVATPGGYIVAGRATSTPGYPGLHAFLMEADRDGNFRWLHIYDQPLVPTLYSLTAVGDGYLLTGRADPANDVVDAFVLKTDLAGNEVWNLTPCLSSAGYTVGWSDAYSADAVKGGYVISGAAWGIHPVLAGGPHSTCLARTDLYSNIAWANWYFFSGGADAGKEVVAVRDGFLVAGIADTYKQVSNQSHIFLLKTNPDGGKEWNVTFTGTADDDVSALLNLSDGYLIVGQNNLEGKAGRANQSLHLIRTDMSGNVVWDNTYLYFPIPSTPTGVVTPAPVPILLVTHTPVPTATLHVNATPVSTLVPTPSPASGYSAMPTLIAAAIALAMLICGKFDRRRRGRR